LAPLRKTIAASLEIGLHHYSTICVGSYCAFAFFCGDTLSTLHDEMCQFEEVHNMQRKRYMAIKQAILNLQDSNLEHPSVLSGEIFRYESLLDANGLKSDLGNSYTICLMVAYLFGDIQTALKMKNRCKALGNCFNHTSNKLLFYFYDSLVSALVVKKLEKKDEYIQIIAENIRKLGRYAENAPMNYLNKVYLLKAELAVVQNKEVDAETHYEMAVSLSKESEFLIEEAIALERCANLYFDKGAKQHATKLLFQSYSCFKRWGATAKTAHMAQRYPIIANSLKFSSNEFKGEERNRLSCKTIGGTMESVSMMADTLSLTSISTRSLKE